MSKRLQALLAVKAMVAAALPAAEVLGLLGDDAVSDRVPDGGRVVVRAGDPGVPQVDLSPVTYNYEHAMDLEIEVGASATQSGEERIDAMFAAIAARIEADRTLGGVVEYLDAAAPITDDEATDGAPVIRTGSAALVLTYSTPHPL